VNLLPAESKAVLNEIEEENGLLKEQAHGWHGFLHLTLQEYFVGQYAVSVRNGLDKLLRHCGDPWWEEVITLYAGSVRDASPLVNALLVQEKRQRIWKDVFHTSLLLAGQCLGAKPRLEQMALREEIISRLFGLLRRTPYSLTREQVVKILAGIGGNDAWGKLKFLLKDKQENRFIRSNIAQALGQLGDQTVVPELLSILKDQSDESNVRKETGWALRKLGTPEAMLYLPRLIVGSDIHRIDQENALGELMQDYSIIHTFAHSLSHDGPWRDTIHRTLWGFAPRKKVRILMLDWLHIKLIRVTRQR